MRAACGMHAAEAFAFQGLVISPVKLVPVTLLECLPSFRPEATARGRDIGYKQISLSYFSILEEIARSIQ
jgi:hypothetical protein